MNYLTCLPLSLVLKLLWSLITYFMQPLRFGRAQQETPRSGRDGRPPVLEDAIEQIVPSHENTGLGGNEQGLLLSLCVLLVEYVYNDGEEIGARGDISSAARPATVSV